MPATATTLGENSIQIPLGTLMYAILDIGVDSDETSLIKATVVSGPLRGAEVFSTAGASLTGFLDTKVQFTFDQIRLPGSTTTQAITALAVDTETARSSLTTR